MNHTEKDSPAWLLRGLFALLALAVPLLAGYVVYFQWRTPALDFSFDGQTGRVYAVPQNSYANWAGLWPDDVIVSVNGVPFAEWLVPRVGVSMVEIDRNGQRLTLELPIFPLAKLNWLSLISAIVVALIFWGVGVLLLWRQFARADVRLLFLLAQVFAVAALLLLSQPGYWLTPPWTIVLCTACFHIAAPLLVHHVTTFPVLLGSRRQRRWGLGVLYGLAFAGLVGVLSSQALWVRLGVLYSTLEIVFALGILVYVYVRKAVPDDRRRLRLIVFGNLMAALPPTLFYLLPAIAGSMYRMPKWAMGLFLVFAPLSYMYATVRHNLFGIDRLLNRALVYVLLSLGILLLYLGPFLLIYRLAPGDWLAQAMIAAGLTLLVGLTFDWSRRWVQRLVDRVFYGGWYDYPGVVETVSDALARSLDWTHLKDVLTRQVPALMQLRAAHLWIGAPDETLPPQPAEPHLRFTFSLEGRRCAAWTVSGRRDGEEFTAPDRRILKTLADQAEVALNNVLLVETLRRQLGEIREMQHRLLRSREEERARLARDLHDGPIQLLVGLNMQLGLLLAATGKETLSASEELQAMRAEVRRLLAELRQVCAELRPPMLDTLGLGAALRALAEEWSEQSGVPITLDLPPDHTLRALPGEVTVNLYRVAQESLSNVARHAAARQVALSLVWEADRLTLTVRDDGRGFVLPEVLHDLTAQEHFGLMGMQERVALIGGRLMIESAPGQGTTVRVTYQTPIPVGVC
ncbi:MAG TPA: histidine kinase [Anaerolineae bacterium]|nr:histidine kinase [Anaerolineae bacterium]HQK13081.1 histidine kinase [Anaerolineae bacterium]